jgi:hypothetical protein
VTYLKSVLAGLVAVFSVAVLLFIGMAIYFSILTSTEHGKGAIGWDPISVVRPGLVIIIVAVFVAGFLWEFRRVSR